MELKKCYDDIPSPFSLGDGTPINYPKLCYGDSLDEDKDEMPLWLLLYW